MWVPAEGGHQPPRVDIPRKCPTERWPAGQGAKAAGEGLSEKARGLGRGSPTVNIAGTPGWACSKPFVYINSFNTHKRLCHECSFEPHPTAEETEAQRDGVSCSGSPSQQRAEPGFEAGLSGSRPHAEEEGLWQWGEGEEKDFKDKAV